jgi:hypothetical protein
MKTIQPWMAVVTAAVLLASNVNAGHHDRGRTHHEPSRYHKTSNHHHANWVVPLVIGGVLGYAFSDPRRERVTYHQSTSVVYTPQPMYQEQWVYFGDCDCQRKVLVRLR